jgi:hypothetical protein
MLQLAFSLPVHEDNLVVTNQLKNIFKYNPGCTVVLHVSKLFVDFDRQYFQSMPGVVINPHRYRLFHDGRVFLHGTGLLLSHCSNFCYLQEIGLSFDTFCLISSNEMFVREGLADYVNQVKNGFQAVRFDLKQDWHVFSRRIDQHPSLSALLDSLDTNIVYGGQTEGQFFEKTLFQRICNLYFTVFGEREINDFETEEVVPQTVAMALGIKPSLPFTLVDYTHHDFQITKELISVLTDPIYYNKVKLNLGPKGNGMLVSPHVNSDNHSVFSVKRVPRNVNDPLRIFINQL